MGKLSALKVSKTAQPGRHSDGDGLYLNVTATGAKSWVFLWQKDGKRREMGLGSLNAIPLTDARQRAAECRKQVADGLDPITERDAKKAARSASATTVITFEQCAKAYITSHEAGWRNPKHRQQWRNTLDTYVYPVFGAVPIGEVDSVRVLEALTPIWYEKTETANRIRGRIETILDFATVKGLRQGENPAQWRGRLAHALPSKGKITKVKHHPALSARETPGFIAALKTRAGMAPLCLQFAVLTAARSGEARCAIWSEIDLENALWIIPAERMKGEREHIVPLSPQAIKLLEHVQPLAAGPDSIVFPNKRGRALSDMALTAVIRRMNKPGLTVHFTAHGFRSTFRDWAEDDAKFSSETAEKALAHAVRNKTERAYRRGDALEERKILMPLWGNFVSGEKA